MRFVPVAGRGAVRGSANRNSCTLGSPNVKMRLNDDFFNGLKGS